MRKRIFEIIEVGDGNDRVSNIYDVGMMITIIVSLISLAFKATNIVFEWFGYITVTIFIVDYLLRLITADFKLSRKKSRRLFSIHLLRWLLLICCQYFLPSQY